MVARSSTKGDKRKHSQESKALENVYKSSCFFVTVDIERNQVDRSHDLNADTNFYFLDKKFW